MTVCEAIAICDTLCPNCLDGALKLRFLSEAEGAIAERVGATIPAPYREDTDPDTPLLVPYPFDMIYRHYLMAQIALAGGEYERYNNCILLYNTALCAYTRFVLRTRQAAGGV